MEQNDFMLLTAAVLGTIAVIFTIVGVAAPGWFDWSDLLGRTRLLNCGQSCGRDYTAAGVLLIIAIVVLTIAIVFTVLFLRRLIDKHSDKIKATVFALFIIAAIFIITAYSRTIPNTYYSYHVTVTAGVLAFLSTIFFTYWLGRTSVASLP